MRFDCSKNAYLTRFHLASLDVSVWILYDPSFVILLLYFNETIVGTFSARLVPHHTSSSSEWRYCCPFLWVKPGDSRKAQTLFGFYITTRGLHIKQWSLQSPRPFCLLSASHYNWISFYLWSSYAFKYGHLSGTKPSFLHSQFQKDPAHSLNYRLISCCWSESWLDLTDSIIDYGSL